MKKQMALIPIAKIPAAHQAVANPFAGRNRKRRAKRTPPIDPNDPTIALCTPLLNALQ